MKSVVTSYKVLEPSFLSNALEVEARKFSNKFFDNVFPLFPSQMLSIKTSFGEKIAPLKSLKKMASFSIVENASLATTYPDVCTAYMMYMIVPVTVATAERSFSKLKLIKNFLQSSMSQERLSGLALPLSSSFEEYPLQVRRKQDWGRGFIPLLTQIAALPESDAGSDVIKSASSFIIQNRQTSCSMWCPMYRARC